MSNIQISYEDNLKPLAAEMEERTRSNILTILKKSGNRYKGVSLFFCHPETIKNLNHAYRKVDQPTDILSWSYEDDEPIPGAEYLLGELAICLEICSEQAKNTGWDLESELLRLIVHGIGHLMGYDHELSEAEERRMLEFEKEMLASINLNGIYD